MTSMAKRKQPRGNKGSRQGAGAGGHGRGPKRRGSGEAQVWLYGGHAVLAAIRNKNRKIQRLILATASRKALEADLTRALEARAEAAASPRLETIQAEEFGRILPRAAVHQGIAALCQPLPDAGIEVLQPDGGPAIVLDQVTDPQNVGAILRSAAVFGAQAVVTTDRHAPEATGALAKAASGALETVPLVRVTNLARALGAMRDMGFWLIGLDAGAEMPLAEAKGDGPTALVLGAEGKGLRRLTAETCDALARLPVAPGAEAADIGSLNVSAAAAVALYELVREE